MKYALAVGCILLLGVTGWVGQSSRALSPTPTPITPVPSVVPYVSQSVTVSTNLVMNYQFGADDFGLIENWTQTNIDLRRWYLVQDVQPDQRNARWVDRVDLDGKGFALRSTDGQTCDRFCSTEAVQIVAAEANTYYTLSASARVERGSAALYLDFLDAKRERIQPFTRGGYTNRWTWQTVAAKAPAGTHFIRVILYTGNTGQAVAYWRDIQLHSISPEVAAIPEGAINVALEKPVIDRAGGVTYADWGNADDAADYNTTTLPDGGRWGTQTSQGTFETVDLGSAYTLVGVGYHIEWDRAFQNPLTFQVEVSMDNAKWTKVYTGIHEPALGDGNNQTSIDIPINPIRARYVRFSEPVDGAWNGWGSIFQLRAYSFVVDSDPSTPILIFPTNTPAQ